MKAMVNTVYGPPEVLQLQEVEKPTPKEDEVLVKVLAVGVNGSDWEGLSGKPLYARLGGLRKPSAHILGSDIAGRVEMAGSRVSQFQPGEAVFGEVPGYHGGFAEYVCVPENRLARKPGRLTFDEAAAIPQPGVIALQGIRVNGQVQPGQKVLINGAGGGTGMFAVQLAKFYGAEVTGVDNTGKMDFLRSLGADHVIDYTREDFARNGSRYDLILDISAHRSALVTQRALKPNGNYFFVGGSVAVLFQVLLLGPWIRRSTGKNIRLLAVRPNREDMEFITEMCEAGKIHPVIDRRYPLKDAAEALRYVGEGRARGKVIITVGEDPKT
jgi:NADPH:quinone reductase-like Zn-dependent oxidoreductase